MYRESQEQAGFTALEDITRHFNLRYLFAVINSTMMRIHPENNHMVGTRGGRIYPNVRKTAPIKVVDAFEQERIGVLVDRIQAQHEAIDRVPTAAAILAHWRRDERLARPLLDYIVTGQIEVVGDPTATKKSGYRLEGRRVRLDGRSAALEVRGDRRAALLDFFVRYLAHVGPELPGRTWEEVRSAVLLPPTLDDVHTCLTKVEAAETTRGRLVEVIGVLMRQIEGSVRAVYAAEADASLSMAIEESRQATQVPLTPEPVHSEDVPESE